MPCLESCLKPFNNLVFTCVGKTGTALPANIAGTQKSRNTHGSLRRTQSDKTVQFCIRITPIPPQNVHDFPFSGSRHALCTSHGQRGQACGERSQGQSTLINDWYRALPSSSLYWIKSESSHGTRSLAPPAMNHSDQVSAGNKGKLSPQQVTQKSGAKNQA